MKNVRLALATALIVSLGVIFALWKTTFTGWPAGVALGVTIVAVFFSAAVVILLIATLFRTKGDLWDTAFFHYMRIFWGDKWGGRAKYRTPLQISVCRATWLSVITLFAWVLPVGWCGSLTWFFIEAVTQPAGYLGENFGQTVAAAWILGTIGLLVLMYAVALRDSFEYELPKFYKAGAITFFLFGIFFSVITLIVIPIKQNGISAYLITVGAIVGTIAVILGIIWLIKSGFPKLADTLKKETVPGVLVSARFEGWKKKVCPLIIQELSENEEIIEKINAWQNSIAHPLTCRKDSTHRLLRPEIRKGKVILVCPDCDYVQTNIPEVVLKAQI